MTEPKVESSRASRSVILVVDDDAAIRTLVARVLSASNKVISASDPHEALAVASRESSVDLLVLDIMLPAMTGFDLAKRLRMLPSCAKAKVMFLSALDTPTDKIKGIQAGARNYVTKPFKIDDLVARVNRTLAR